MIVGQVEPNVFTTQLSESLPGHGRYFMMVPDKWTSFRMIGGMASGRNSGQAKHHHLEFARPASSNTGNSYGFQEPGRQPPANPAKLSFGPAGLDGALKPTLGNPGLSIRGALGAYATSPPIGGSGWWAVAVRSGVDRGPSGRRGAGRVANRRYSLSMGVVGIGRGCRVPGDDRDNNPAYPGRRGDRRPYSGSQWLVISCHFGGGARAAGSNFSNRVDLSIFQSFVCRPRALSPAAFSHLSRTWGSRSFGPHHSPYLRTMSSALTH